MGKRAQQCFLHEIVGAIDMTAQRDRESAQARHCRKHLIAYGGIELHAAGSSCSLSRRTKSLMCWGTPSLTTSSYKARSCWPMRACTSRPRRTSLFRGVGRPILSQACGVSASGADGSTLTGLPGFMFLYPSDPSFAGRLPQTLSNNALPIGWFRSLEPILGTLIVRVRSRP